MAKKENFIERKRFKLKKMEQKEQIKENVFMKFCKNMKMMNQKMKYQY